MQYKMEKDRVKQKESKCPEPKNMPLLCPYSMLGAMI